MLEASSTIAAYVARGRAVFDTDPALQDAIVYQIIVLGEAAKAVLAADPSLETDLPEIAWSSIARMRDRLTHHYWSNDREVIWATASGPVPEVHQLLLAALDRLE
jgi:uncharacterized protein with HEPN domain